MEHTDSVTCVPPDDATENDNRDYWAAAFVIIPMVALLIFVLLDR